MEIDIHSAVSGAPPASRVKRHVRRVARAVREQEGGGLRPSRVHRDSFRPGEAASYPRIPVRESKQEISILFCGDARMRALNRRYRHRNRSTDVLAFPGEGAALGDIVISVPYARRQARRRGESRAREIERLLLHGYLHLLGYDHETDQGEMDLLEGELRGRLGLVSADDATVPPSGRSRTQDLAVPGARRPSVGNPAIARRREVNA